jgi:hypothetical protein
LNLWCLRLARGLPTFPNNPPELWQKALRQAEAELAAARKRTEINEAARKLQYAKARLKALEDVPAGPPKRNPSRGTQSGAAS